MCQIIHQVRTRAAIVSARDQSPHNYLSPRFLNKTRVQVGLKKQCDSGLASSQRLLDMLCWTCSSRKLHISGAWKSVHSLCVAPPFYGDTTVTCLDTFNTHCPLTMSSWPRGGMISLSRKCALSRNVSYLGKYIPVLWNSTSALYLDTENH